jgi:hypothetical protein
VLVAELLKLLDELVNRHSAPRLLSSEKRFII